MSNIVNINNIKKSNYIPITDKDFDNLYVYKINTLLRVLKKEKKHRQKLIDNIFIRLTKQDDIDNFISFLIENNLYNNYVSSILEKDDELYKMHLALYYDNDYINIIYKSKYNLAKQIYKYGKSYQLRNYTYDYLIKLSSLECDYKTLALIKKIVIKLLKKESKDLRIYKLRELFFGNYLLQFNNELIKQEEVKKITKVLKTVDENYNNEYEDY